MKLLKFESNVISKNFYNICYNSVLTKCCTKCPCASKSCKVVGLDLVKAKTFRASTALQLFDEHFEASNLHKL